MTTKDHREWYKVEITIPPKRQPQVQRSRQVLPFLDNGTLIHRIGGQQPTGKHIEGLKYKELLRERGSETALE